MSEEAEGGAPHTRSRSKRRYFWYTLIYSSSVEIPIFAEPAEIFTISMWKESTRISFFGLETKDEGTKAESYGTCCNHNRQSTVDLHH
jgi:hypothetical protein